jgi:hypothetical protein
MDTPNTPNLENLEPSFPDNASTDDIKEQAAEIAAIVERDRKRRNRSVYTLLGLVGLTVALAGVVFAYGFSGQDAMGEAVKREVSATSEMQVTTVTKRLEDKLPTLVQDKLPDALETTLPGVVNKTVKDQVADQFEQDVAPTLYNFSNQIQALEDRGTSSPALAQFTSTEVGKIKKAISEDLPKYQNELQRVNGRVDEIATVSDAARSWKEERSAILERLETLEGDMTKRLVQLASLSTKLDGALQQIGGGKDPCSVAADLNAAVFRTYTAKENTTSWFHDLEFKVKLKDVKDRTVRGLTVFRPEHVLLAERDVMMGNMITFEDNVFRYNLIPIFVNKRLLINDFVGFAISKARKCPTPATK